jgi:tetratricopeptide (TPR) repeat protein
MADAKARETVKAGDAAYYADRWIDALRHYERAIDLSPAPTCGVVNDMGIVLNKMGRWAEAVSAFTCALELDSKDPAVWTNRSQAHLQGGRFAEAIADASRALQLRPNYALAWRYQSRALSGIGLHVTAVKVARQCVELVPGDWSAHEALADVLSAREWLS